MIQNIIKQAYWHNSDGSGIVHMCDPYTVHKTFKLSETLDYASKADGINKTLVHLRYGTSGSRTTDQIHPIKINNNLMIAHNGVISDHALAPYRDRYQIRKHRHNSDTQDLAQVMSKAVYHGHDHLKILNDPAIANGNRYALINSNTETIDLYGHWLQINGDLAVSNDHY